MQTSQPGFTTSHFAAAQGNPSPGVLPERRSSRNGSALITHQSGQAQGGRDAVSPPATSVRCGGRSQEEARSGPVQKIHAAKRVNTGTSQRPPPPRPPHLGFFHDMAGSSTASEAPAACRTSERYTRTAPDRAPAHQTQQWPLIPGRGFGDVGQ